MDDTQFEALENWILAAIARSEVRGSCGPHVRPIVKDYNHRRNIARDALVLSLAYMKETKP